MKNDAHLYGNAAGHFLWQDAYFIAHLFYNSTEAFSVLRYCFVLLKQGDQTTAKANHLRGKAEVFKFFMNHGATIVLIAVLY